MQNKKKLKILHVYKTYYPDTTGGIEMVLQQLMHGLNDFDVESKLFVLSPSAIPEKINAPEGLIIRSKTTIDIASNPMSMGAFLKFAQEAKWADIIHYQFPWPFADILHIFSTYKKPSIISYQSDIVRQKFLMPFYGPLMNIFLSKSHRICASSPAYVASSSVLSKFSKKVMVIPNGINESACPPASLPCINQWKNKLGEGFFLFIGVLRYYKGLHTLIQAAAINNLPVVIAGEGPEEIELKNQAKKYGAKNIYFVGHISDEEKSALLSLCGAFVFPSHLRSEAFGMSLVEASMYQKPLISCEIGTGTTFVNIDGETGLVVPAEDAKALAQAMQKLHQNPQLSSAMGRAAYQRYQQLFTASAMARQYRKVYDDVLQEQA